MRIVPSPLAEAPLSDRGVPRMELEEWAERYGLVAGITTRGEPGAAFSLGLWNEEPAARVMARWRAFQAAVGAQFPAVILSHQVHGTEVAWQEEATPGWHVQDGWDGHATAASGALLTITVADCIPVYLAVPGKPCVALVHAGWRGVAGNILSQAVALLRRTAQCTSSEIVMHCGVGICGACYEVGSEVYERLTARASAGAAHVDLRAVLVGQGAELGLEEATVSPFCTAHDHDRFFSHRASGGRDGRMVAYVGIPRR